MSRAALFLGTREDAGGRLKNSFRWLDWREFVMLPPKSSDAAWKVARSLRGCESINRDRI